MGMHEYQQVLEDFCYRAEQVELDSMLHEASARVGRTSVRIGYNNELDCCRVRVALCGADGLYPPVFLQTLLEANAELEGPGLPSFGIDENSGTAVLLLHFPVTRLLAGPTLYDILDAHLAPLIAQWTDLLVSVHAPDDQLQTSTGFFV